MSCVAVNCTSRTTIGGVRQTDLSFHNFPKSPEIRNVWIKAIGRENWEPNKYSRLCSKHFEASCFISGLQIQKLKTEAVPTIFETRQELLKNNKRPSLKKRKRRQPTHETPLPKTYEPPIPDSKTLIFRVYRYLQNEYFYLRDRIGLAFDLDLTPLANILERTSEATGVSKQVIAAILEEKQAEWSDTDSAPEAHTLLTEYTNGNGSNIRKRYRKRSSKPRYSKRKREKIKKREMARKSFVQNLQTIAVPQISSSVAEPKNKEIPDENCQDLSRSNSDKSGTQTASEQGDKQLEDEGEYRLISIKVEVGEERIEDRLGHQVVDTSPSVRVNSNSVQEVNGLQSSSSHPSTSDLSHNVELKSEPPDDHSYYSVGLTSIPGITEYGNVGHLVHDHNYCLKLCHSDPRADQVWVL